MPCDDPVLETSARCHFVSADFDVVEQSTMVAQVGYWAPPGGTVFYSCARPIACLPGVNGSRSMCASGYDGVVCSACAKGYFEQFGR